MYARSAVKVISNELAKITSTGLTQKEIQTDFHIAVATAIAQANDRIPGDYQASVRKSLVAPVESIVYPFIHDVSVAPLEPLSKKNGLRKIRTLARIRR